jgi:hypothetical protein
VYDKLYLDFEKNQDTVRNERGSCMKKRFLTLFISGITLVVLTVSGLSCVGYDQGTTGDDCSLWDASKFKEFITLDSSSIVERLQNIDPPYEGDSVDQPTQDGFDAIRDWVAANIEYKTDEEQWGVDEYRQTPEETISLHTGDCEAFAVLL